ncbi:MAG: hypothetical protein BMS9Abin23_1031 [Thermodesulfobacteriota bacterium]|nr:MAG: hypothetical protein BMS9Abin23_1031 [Thermodesulfobacteriota bacterium]
MGSLHKNTGKSGDEKILVINDGAEETDFFRKVLSSKGFVARFADGGEDVLKTVRQWHPSVILLNLSGTDKKVLDMCRKIRELSTNHRPSIIVVSEKKEKRNLLDIISGGADDLIFKPLDEAELNARIMEQIRIGGFYETLNEEKKNIESLVEISYAISASLNPREVFKTIVTRVAEATGAERCSIVLVSNEDEGYVLASHDDPGLRNLKIDLSKYPEIQAAVKSKKPLFIDEMTSHPIMKGVQSFIYKLRDKSVLIVPIVFNDRVLGTIFLRTKKKAHGFSKDEIAFCRIVANSSFHAIRNARIYQKLTDEKEHLREASIRDHLTSLYNHNHFYLRLEEDFERASRYNTPLSLIMMDIDNFKRINDNYGHRTGDMVLKEIAETIWKAIRKSDIVARYGGEEFAIILPHTDLAGARGEAERLRSIIEGHSYKDLPGVNITMSLGVASYPHEKIKDHGDLVNRADDALYRAKKSGRNRVEVDNGKD